MLSYQLPLPRLAHQQCAAIVISRSPVCSFNSALTGSLVASNCCYPTEPSDSERTPLLEGVNATSSRHSSSPPVTEEGITNNPKRVHFLDNLRVTLLVPLVLHHAVISVVQARFDTPHIELVILSLFSVTNKSCLWTTFFLVSGYANALALSRPTDGLNTSAACDLDTASSNDDFERQSSEPHSDVQERSKRRISPDLSRFYSHTISVLFPAIIYTLLIQPLLFLHLSSSFPTVFGSRDESWAYLRLAGPVSYIVLLSACVYGHLIVRFVRRSLGRNSSTTPGNQEENPTDGCSKHQALYIPPVILLLATYTYLSCVGLSPIPSSVLFFFVTIGYDTISPDAPASYMAFVLGLNLPTILPRLPSALPLFASATPSSDRPNLRPSLLWGALLLALLISWSSMGIAQHLSTSLFEHIRIKKYFEGFQLFVDGGFNAHTIFFLIWHTFNTLSIPVLSLLCFSATSFTRRKWTGPISRSGEASDAVVRRVGVVPYLHMVPILVAVDAARRIGPDYVVIDCVFVSVVGVAVSWTLASPVILWDAWN